MFAYLHNLITTPPRWGVTLPLVYMGTIYLLSSLSGTPSAGHGYFLLALLPDELRNPLHVPLYAGLAFLWRWALPAWKAPGGGATLIAACVPFLYGGLDEWHQLSVPGRYGTIGDLELDLMGVFAGLVFFYLLVGTDPEARHRKPKQSKGP